jgi:tRNA-2-methylthio-N6-dimethylallyladenosine synthase
VLKEVRELVENGCREITLLGQNVNSYSGGCDFADLLADICEIDGDFIVRFMTSHPKDVSHKLIDTMAKYSKIARQFHLPLQSGSNRVLSAMNRRYTAESYIENVRYMREKMPDIALSTDIIVGFPTETDEEFEETLNVLREVRYDSIFSFIYSIRKGTKAAEMEGQISDEVKKERFARLLDTQNQISYEKNQSYVGKVIDVLVEGRSKTDDSKLTGRGERGRLVHFVGDDSLIGCHVNVKIVKAETYALYGEL